jgi:DinB superfamily
MELEHLRFPVGRMSIPATYTADDLQGWITDIIALPRLMREAVQNCTIAELETPYRPDGWTLRQVVHHTADSHTQAYTRFKLALTEDNPTIKPYEEQLWAELPDSKMEIEISLRLLEALHARWAMILRGMSAADFERTYFHPGMQQSFSLGQVAYMYSWHSRHHTAHIKLVKK